MSKLPSLKSKDVIRALQKAGHKIFKKDNRRVTVPVHSRDLKKGTLYGIIEQAGLTVEEFIELLQ